MSCFEGGTYTDALELDIWHDLESFFDSRTGCSPLMQICRMCNKAREAIGLPDYSFHRVGANPVDTAWADVDYEAHPEWNPLQDYYQILQQCMVIVSTCFTNMIANDECKIARFLYPGPAWANYLAAISGKNLLLKENWAPIIYALRDLLGAMETIEEDPWDRIINSTSVSLYPQRVIEGHALRNDPDAIVPVTGGNRIVFGHYISDGGGEYNVYGGAEDQCGSTFSGPVTPTSYLLSSIGVLYTGPFVYKYGTVFETRNFSGPSGLSGPFATATFTGTCQGVFGWKTVTKATYTYTFSRLYALAKPAGQETHWEITLTNTVDITGHLSTAGGTIVWDEDEATREVTVDVFLDSVNPSLPVRLIKTSDGHARPLPNQIFPKIKIIEPYGYVCKDACNNYHLET